MRVPGTVARTARPAAIHIEQALGPTFIIGCCEAAIHQRMLESAECRTYKAAVQKYVAASAILVADSRGFV